MRVVVGSALEPTARLIGRGQQCGGTGLGLLVAKASEEMGADEPVHVGDPRHSGARRGLRLEFVRSLRPGRGEQAATAECAPTFEPRIGAGAIRCERGVLGDGIDTGLKLRCGRFIRREDTQLPTQHGEFALRRSRTELRIVVRGHRQHPFENDGIGREKRREREHKSLPFVEAGEGLVEDAANLLLAMPDLVGDGRVLLEGIRGGEPLGAEALPIRLRVDVRVSTQESGYEFDRDRESAELDAEPTDTRFVSRIVGKPATRLVVPHQCHRVLDRQRNDLDNAQVFASAKGLRIKPGRHDEFEPLRGGEERELVGREERGLVHVVKDEQEAGLDRGKQVFGLADAVGVLAKVVEQLGGPLLREELEVRDHALCRGERVSSCLGGDFESQLPVGPQLFERCRKALEAFTVHQPPPTGGVEIGVGVRVLNGERGLPLAAESIHRGDDAAPVGNQVLVEFAQFAVAPDEVGIVPSQTHIAGGVVGKQSPIQALREKTIEFGEALTEQDHLFCVLFGLRAELGETLLRIELLEDVGPMGEPGAEVEAGAGVEGAGERGVTGIEVDLASPHLVRDFVEPAGGLRVGPQFRLQCDEVLGGLRTRHSRHDREVDGGDSVVAAREGVLAAQKLLPLPATVLGAQPIGGEKRQEQSGSAEALAQASAPIRHLIDLDLIEEDP